jgi:thioredoxin-like negative regulator of GroEL
VPVLDSIGNIMHRENMEVKIVKIDCEENQEISRQYNIRQVPSLILSIAGEKFEYNGIRDEINIIKWIKDKI